MVKTAWMHSGSDGANPDDTIGITESSKAGPLTHAVWL